MKLRIEIVTALDRWADLAGAWNELLDKSPSATPFLTWEWLYTWGECYLTPTRELFILLLYKDQELVGIAPWYIEHSRYRWMRRKSIMFLGSPEAGSDYLDVIAKKGREQEVSSFLYQFLQSEGRHFWTCIQLRDIPSISPFLLHFTHEIEQAGKHVEARLGSFCPTATLPDSYQSFLDTLSANRREQFRRHARLLTNNHSTEYRSVITAPGDQALQDWLVLYQTKNQYYSQAMHQFLQKLAVRVGGQGIMQIDLLLSESRTIAGLLHLRFRNNLYMYLMTIDKDFDPKISVGNVIVGMAIEKAIDNGMHHYDFLKGTEQYKFHWSDDGQRSIDLYVPNKCAANFFQLIESSMKNFIKFVIR